MSVGRSVCLSVGRSVTHLTIQTAFLTLFLINTHLPDPAEAQGRRRHYFAPLLLPLLPTSLLCSMPLLEDHPQRTFVEGSSSYLFFSFFGCIFMCVLIRVYLFSSSIFLYIYISYVFWYRMQYTTSKSAHNRVQSPSEAKKESSLASRCTPLQCNIYRKRKRHAMKSGITSLTIPKLK